MIAPAELAWIAGIVEGEGWLGLHTDQQPVIRVGMTDRDVIDRLAQFWGVKVAIVQPRPPGRKTQYIATVAGPRAAGWMATLYRFLGHRRRARARAVLVAWKTSPVNFRYRRQCPRGHPYDAANTRRNAKGGRVCRACERLKGTAWARANRAWYREYARGWRARNRDRSREYERRYRARARRDTRQLDLAV